MLNILKIINNLCFVGCGGKLAISAFSLGKAMGKMQNVLMRAGKKAAGKKRINFALGV